MLYFRNDDQILLVRRDSSGWFSLSVVPISYVVGVGCSSLLFLVLSWIVFRCFQNPLLFVIWNVKVHLFRFKLYTLCRMVFCSYLELALL